MKKIIVLMLILSLVMLCGCNAAGNGDVSTTAPNTTGVPAGTETTAPAGGETLPTDWETPIDVDDSFLEDEIDVATEPAATEVTEPEATEPGSTEPAATEPAATEPAATEPASTEPKPTTPPNGNGSSGPIELPMVPG